VNTVTETFHPPGSLAVKIKKVILLVEQILYLTPASIGYLTQFILALLIDAYLLHRLKRQKTQNNSAILLAFIFLTLTIFIGLLFFDTALPPSQRLFVVYFENTVLALTFFLLVRFSLFYFGNMNRPQRIIAQLFSSLSLLYFFYELQISIERLYYLVFDGIVDYRPPESDYFLVFVFALIPLTFARQTIALDERPVSWLRKLWRPQGQKAQSAQAFALTFFLAIPLTISNILRGNSLISTTIFNISLSLGMLGVVWLFANAYLRYAPGNPSFLVKISAASLTVILAVLGVAGWMITLPFFSTYQPGLTGKQALRFTPNELGGYDISEIPFNLERNLGERLPVTSRGSGRNQRIEFTFPFYRQEYTDLYVTSVGAVLMGESLYHPNLQYHYGNFPAIFPLLIDLEPDKGGGVYARKEPERLVITWEHIPALHNQSAFFTFQTILYADGIFDIVYDELPATPLFRADSSPSANPWLRGVTPGLPDLVAISQDFQLPLQSGPQGLIQDFYIDFRHRQHEFLAPLAWLIVMSSAMIVLGLPILIRRFFLHPLQVLLSGVEQIQAGSLSVQIPVESDDEIGFVASAFNEMTRQVNYLVNHLEELIAERTSKLHDSNLRLQLEIREREAVRETLLRQQRSLAAAEEREQISRDLHDGLGQLLGYINVQAQTVKMLLEKNQVNAAQNNLNLLIESAQQTQTELRQHILGMRSSKENRQGFHETLQNYLNAFGKTWGIETSLDLPGNWPSLAGTVEDQLLHIVREALANIRKHAQASQVKISATMEPNTIVLTIADNGIGFNLLHNPVEQQNHYGLNIMRERADQFGGLLEITSSPGNGTQVIVQVPCLPEDETVQEPVRLGALRLLLVDDHPIFLSGFRNLLTTRGLTVVGTAVNGFEAFEKVEQLHPDVVLMDVHMPLCDGIQGTRIIKAEFPETRVILLTVSGEEENLLRGIKYGASGYLNKNMNIDEILNMIYDAVRGEIQIGPPTALQLLSEINPPEADPLLAANVSVSQAFPSQLNVRQWDVLRLVANGLTYKDVGRELGLTERTIKYHMTQILQNLQLENRAQGVKYAQQFQKDITKPVRR
jgi:signal transduction histidine kinase/DNA-binding NarL/FixJ family response regulator